MTEDITIESLRARLIERIAELAELSPERVDPRSPLDEYGLSSRQAVELAGELEDLLDRPLSTTMLWEHPTIDHLAAALGGSREAAAPETPRENGAADEPVAIVGLGCRLPGGISGPERFWNALCAGEDLIGEVPEGRWQDRPDQESGTTRWGGFLDDIAGFDAEFFGITPREAARMDPQQRMLLELAWESLEHSGTAPRSLAGSETGVFIGISGTEYGARSLADVSGMDPWAGTGAALSIAANRLSYVLDLRGPSIAVDTACSSSLSAVHLAVSSLRQGECDTALVGGANLLLDPGVTASFDQMGISSATGRCQPFAAGADGIVRAEGAAMVVLKPLSRARSAGDRVLAVIRSCATNSDGRSNGLTAPNPQSQQALLRTAYRKAGVEPADVDYVEAHGTGTLLGDPIEARALAQVLAGEHNDRGQRHPLLVGSVKSNTGHLEAAAGITGLIKTVLALHHGQIPATLHYERPNPHIDFAELNLSVVDSARPWPVGTRPGLAGVSGFGFGGANAHVVLEQAPCEHAPHPPAEEVYRLFFGAPTENRLARKAALFHDWLHVHGSGAEPADVQHTLARRLEGRQRAAVVGTDRTELLSGLRSLSRGERSPQVVNTTETGAGAPLFVFSGHGSQWSGMARQLLEHEPAFAAAVDRLDPVITEASGYSLRAEILHDFSAAGMDRVQPVLFGIQLALVELWRRHGVEPAAVLGHSFGEVTAAVVAGALSEADGSRIVALRSRLLASLAGDGAMALLELGAAEADSLVADVAGVEIAVLSAPDQTVVAGAHEPVHRVVEEVDARGLLAKLVKLDVAAHSPVVDPVLDELRDGLTGLTPGKALLDFYSTASPDPRDEPSFGPEYWASNLRNPVRFTDAVTAAVEDGYHTFVEISPHPVLRHSLLGSGAPLAIHSIQSGSEELPEFHRQLATVELTRRTGPATDGSIIDLPGTPWEHTRHWLPGTTGNRTPGRGHPLLGSHVEVPATGEHVFSTELGPADPDWLFEHELGGRAVLPATAYVEMVSAATRTVFDVAAERIEIDELTMHLPLPLTERTRITTTVTGFGHDSATVTVHGAQQDGWQLHATAEIRIDGPGNSITVPEHRAPEIPEEDGHTELSPGLLHSTLEDLGIRYGPSFDIITQLSTRPEPDTGRAGAFATLAPRPRAGTGQPLDPVVLDACVRTLAAALLPSTATDDPTAYLPMSIGAVRTNGDPATGTAIHASVDTADRGGGLLGRAVLTDTAGGVLVELADVLLAPVDTRAEEGSDFSGSTEPLLESHWLATEPPLDETGPDPGSVLVCGTGDSGLADAIAARAGAGTKRVDYRDAEEIGPAAGRFGSEAVAIVLPRIQADGEQGLAEAERAVLAVATTVRALSEHTGDTGASPRLSLITCGAVALDDAESGQPAFAALRGIVRVLAYEHPELRACIVDLDPADDEHRNASRVLREMRARDDEIAWRGGTRYARRLGHGSIPSVSADIPVARPDGGYVITGGLGGLGLLLARWFAEQGAGRVVLNARSGPDRAAQERIAEIREMGTAVEVVRGDIAEDGVAERLLATAGRGTTVRGVLHAAAVFTDRTISRLDAETLHESWRAKAYGAHRLHEASLGYELDFWVGFSSVAALHGLPGQPAYAGANGYLDALVSLRRANGLPGLTISWGTWAEIGAAADVRIPWMEPIRPRRALDVLGSILATDANGLAPARLNLGLLTEAFPSIAALPLFSELVRSHRAAEPAPDAGPDGWQGVGHLAELDAASAHAAVCEQLRARLASVLGFEPAHLDTVSPLPEIGVDSLLAVRIRNAVQHDFGCSLPVSLLLRGASVVETERWLCAELGVTAQPDPPGQTEEVLIGPRDAAERLVASAWQEVLDAPVGVTQDFYAIGGNHGDAEAITALLVERSGRELTVAELFELPSIERMAAHLREPEHDGAPLRVLRAGGSRRPLFVFHPGGGDTAVYHQLVQRLDPEMPVYGFDRIEDVGDVEGRVAHYLPELREVQPHGPYRLAGWSFGGFLAFEMAQRLRQAGEAVELVAVMDPILPLPDPDDLSEVELTRRRFERFGEFLESSYGKRIDLPYERLSRLDEQRQVNLLIDTMREAGLVNNAVSDAILNHQRTSFLDARALERYRPDPYSGRVLYFSAAEEVPGGLRDQRFDRADPAKGWDACCTDIEIVSVPGHHLSMLDPPNVDLIGKQLDEALTETAPSGTGSVRGPGRP